jgi:hypothetical protein
MKPLSLTRVVRFFKQKIEQVGEKMVRSNIQNLESLDFFHRVFFGQTGHLCPGWKSSDGMFHSDAPIAIVAKRKGKVSGIIGFEITGNTLLVRQIQGAPRGNFHDGTKAEEFLLHCAEEITKALGLRYIRVIDAETAINYRRAAPVTEQPSAQAEAHMRRIYSFPASTGRYVHRFCLRLRTKTFFCELTPF